MKMSMPDRVKQFLNLMNSQENGERLYKYLGGYWEVIYPMFLKYAPEELKTYENTAVEEFVNFNPRVKELLDAGNEEENWANAINYYNGRLKYYNASDQHIIEIDYDLMKDDEDDYIGYIPNEITAKRNEDEAY